MGMDKREPPAYTRPVWQSGTPSLRPDAVRFKEVLLVAATIIGMTYGGIVGIGIVYLLWLPRLLMEGPKFPPAKALVFPILIGGYLLLSTLWSAHAAGTARGSLEFASMLVCTAMMARTVSVNSFIMGIVAGACAILLAVMASGGGGGDAPLVGFLGSKNQVGSIAEVDIYCALLSLLIYRNFLLRLLALVPLMICIIVLHMSQSATSSVSLMAMLAASFGMFLIGTLPLRARAPLLFFAVFLIGVAAAAAMTMDLQSAGLGAAGKDSTLTGRTVLWSEGLKTAMDNPVLGVGYGAFWVQGSHGAEVLWEKFGVTQRTGFHFHNLAVNEFVDLGVVGLILWVLAYAVTWGRAMRYVRKNGSSVESIFYVGMMTMYLVRACTEVDTPAPFSFSGLFFFSIVIRVAMRERVVSQTYAAANKPLIRYGTPVSS
jgi:exopolysaccharide production protein ExoQ